MPHLELLPDAVHDTALKTQPLAPEKLGQHWTPNWVAKAMVAYGKAIAPGSMLDPAVGQGVFPLWAKKLGLDLVFTGFETDPGVIQQIPDSSIRKRVIQGDFLTSNIETSFDFIVANPPYVRHHHLSKSYKIHLSRLTERVLGHYIDRRAGLHVYFLIKALSLLKPGGRLSFILPADTFEGVFANPLWEWIAKHYKIDAVVTFQPSASPFPELDVNPVIVFLQRKGPEKTLRWVRVLSRGTGDLYEFVASNFNNWGPDLKVVIRLTNEATNTGLTRPPQPLSPGIRLGDLVSVKRGIATGDNSFFLFNKARLKEYSLLGAKDFLVPVVAKTRYLRGLAFTQSDFAKLEASGKPVYILSPDSRPIEEFPKVVQDYLLLGEKRGITKKYTLANRKPWYKMEKREKPDFFFAYLGRNQPRFVRNLTDAVPLSTVFAVYSHEKDEHFLRQLLLVLNHPLTLRGLVYVAKSYGRGALKAEPKQLEKLIIPDQLKASLLE